VSECLEAFSSGIVSEVIYQEGEKLEIKFHADSPELAKKAFEKMSIRGKERGFERIKDSDVYQVVVIF